MMTLFDKIFAKGRVLAMAHDMVAIFFAWFGAYWLRFNLDGIPDDALIPALLFFPVILVIQAGAFGSFGLYRGIWQFASIPDLIRILKAVTLGTSVSLLTVFLMTRLQGFPRS